jgi:signal transduction histidine kinase
MRHRLSLQLRFTLASMALVSGITALCAIAVYTGQEVLEDELLLELMQREVAEYARAYHLDPSNPPPRSTQLHSYIIDPADTNGLPPELEAVPPGIHHDIVIGNRNYQVANFTLEDKRFYLTYDITLVEEREAWLRYALIASVLAAMGLAGAVGWRLSRVVIAPVTRLADGIKQLDPERPVAGFAQRFPDFEVGAIARAFDHYLQRLADFVVRERSFTEDTSHELRTPITVINTAAERLATDPALPDALRPVVDRIDRAGREMRAITQALLFMARESEPVEHATEAAPLAAIVEETVQAHRRLLAGNPVELRLAVGSAAVPDVPHGLAAIVVRNLLENAIANTTAGAIELTLNGARLAVRDTGAGIPADELPRVFERRFRGRHSSGLGLGLHIVKRICDRQGWRIDAQSSPGQGATFTVTFSTKVEPV